MMFSRKAVAAAALFTIGLAGCASGPRQDANTLDARLAWPCDRFVLTWTVQAAELQTLVGAGLTPVTHDGVGELVFSILRCEPPAGSRSNVPPLLYALTSVPVAADSVPLVITSVPGDGWFALPQVIVDANTSELFAGLGYDVTLADISFVRGTPDSGGSVEIRLQFDGGSVAVAGNAAGEPVAHDNSLALLESSNDFLSAFFGKETADRYTGASVNVQIEGNTPLSPLRLSDTPPSATFDRLLRSDRIFWRLPVAQPR